MGSLHMTIQTGSADRDADRAQAPTCAGCRATSSRRRITPPPRWSSAGPKPAARPRDPKGTPVFAWKGETLENCWWCTEQALEWPDGNGRRSSSTMAATPTLRGAQRRGIRDAPARCRRSTPDTEPRRVGRRSSTRINASRSRRTRALHAHRVDDPRRQRGDDDRRASSATR